MRTRALAGSLGAVALLVLAGLPFGSSAVLATAGPTPRPTAPTATAVPDACSAHAASACAAALLKVINLDRARYGLPALKLARTQSTGTSRCAGSYGHSTAMARSGSIWHINSRYPRASFPNDVCLRYTVVGENVGEASTGSTLQDLRTLETGMMSEPHRRSVCATTVNHACNILNPSFSRLGIGIYTSQAVTWLTEDFTN